MVNRNDFGVKVEEIADIKIEDGEEDACDTFDVDMLNEDEF